MRVVRPVTRSGSLLVSDEFRVGRSISGECWMCGICGVAAVDPTRRGDEDTLRKMAHAIVYRGPDDSGMHVSGGVGLAMRRLSIIDLEGGKQPGPNEEGTVHPVFHGALHN